VQDFLRWPYDEVTADLGGDNRTVVITAPWITATVGVPEEAALNVRELSQKIQQKSLAPQDLGLINWFFGNLKNYPFCYTLPSKKAGESLDVHDVVEPRLPVDSIEAMLQAALDSATLGSEIAKQLATNLNRAVFEWDWESASAFSKTESGIHPESLFSVARRFNLLDVLATNRGNEIFEKIKALPREEFRKAAGLMVRQNHYVTQKCREALQPATGIAKRAAPEIETFMKEENGHDRILEIAIRSFAESAEEIPVTGHTRALMRLLQFAAGHNLLGFAMAVDCFERSAYQKTDPLAQLLKGGGFEMAAKQINRHMEINDSGSHENVACGFLKYMAPVSSEYAKEALRLAEVISLIASSVPASAMAAYEGLTCSGNSLAES